jgi:type IV secretory pathway TraG/TraD family ATPase VirD4
MFSLPRGVDVAVDVPLASSAWESPLAVERLAYRGGAALFVGAIPAFENWPQLRQIYEQGGAALAAITRSELPPAERAKRVEYLEELWRAALLADCIPLGLDDDRHFVTIAGSRSGKGTSAIIPNLCLYPGPLVCLDPKGENASRTAIRRGAGNEYCEGLKQEVFVLDPFGVADVPDELRAGFNPLAVLDPDSSLVVEDAALMAEGLIVATNSKDAHWDDSARDFIKGLILHLIATRERPTLFTLRHFLTQGDREGWEAAKAACADSEALARFKEDCPSPFWYLIDAMQDNPAFAGVIAGAAGTLATAGKDERGSILSTARRNTAFLDSISPRFRETLEGTGRTFAPDVFKQSLRGASLFLCLPAERMGTHGRWLRLMIGLLLERAYRDLSPPKCGAPVLFLLEEFYSLGHMPVIEKAAGYAAGFFIKLWAILQDIQQLKALYPQSWQTFLANAGAMQVFGVSDEDTTSYVSKILGETEVIRHTVNRTGNYQTGKNDPLPPPVGPVKNPLDLVGRILPHSATSEGCSVSESVSQQIQMVPLLRSDEIAIEFARETGAALLLIKGRRPVWCLRVDYYASPWFWGRYAPDEKDVHETKAPRPFGERTPEALAAAAAEIERFRF